MITTQETREALDKMCPVNKANVKRWALHYSQTLRNGRFKRVSKKFVDRCVADVLSTIKHRVQSHPSNGITLQ